MCSMLLIVASMSSFFFSLGVFCRVFAVSCLGPGPLCQSLFAHQARAPADDPSCHPLSAGVAGGQLATCHKNIRDTVMVSIILTDWLVYSLFPGGHVRLSLRCPHALHSYLQTLGPGSHWYVIAHVVMWRVFHHSQVKLLPRVT